MAATTDTRDLRAEARRDLRALLPVFAGTPPVLAAIALWRGPAALWPVWGTIGAAVAAMLVIVLWGALLRERG